MNPVPPFAAWFQRRYGQPTPAQAQAWPLIQNGAHTLIVSPTGTGKTLAAFLAVLDSLAADVESNALASAIHAIYISPLRALSYDLEKNLQTPLTEVYGNTPPIRVALRTGDTPAAERLRQFSQPPHVLLTTPESLCLLLSQPKWLPHFASVRWIIIDEIHALAENKRGTHLALSLERLTDLVANTHTVPEKPGARPTPTPGPAPQRIGLSATVAPLDDIAAFLGGSDRKVSIVDVSASKSIDLQVYTPLQREPYPQAGFSGVRMITELSRLIRQNRTTLVFTNTRSGAESATYWLRDALPELRDQIECHHASLDRDIRHEVEDRLKRGELRAVVCSTSLELGIDIGSIDLVVMLATPKGVNRALQRTGRAGHSIHQISRGLLMATNVGDLIESCATARLARRHHLDAVRIPQAPLDVLAQHLMGMGCIRPWSRTEAFDLVRKAFPYRTLTLPDFNDTLDYLAGGGKSLRQQYTDVFGRIHLDDTTFEARAGNARRDFLQNIGTIPTEGVVRVYLGRQLLGTVEESFVRALRVGSVFVLGGRPVRLDRLGSMECWVRPAGNEPPTVPRWNANKFPLSNRVAREIRAFRGELRQRLESMPFQESPSLIPWIAARLECGERNAAIIFRIHAAQHHFSEIPTAEFLLVEELVEHQPAAPANSPGPAPRPLRASTPSGTDPNQLILRLGPTRPRRLPRPPPTPPPPTEPVQHHYFFHSLIGRSANDALSRVVGLRLGRLKGGNAMASADDYGFILTVTPAQGIQGDDLPQLLSPARFQADLDSAVETSDLLQYHFRNAAQTGLMVYRNYFGEQKSVRKLQWSTEVIFKTLLQHEPDHVLLREARRDTSHTFLDGPRALAYLEDLDQKRRPIRLRSLPCVPPLSFGMYATRIKEALAVEDPRETLERLYHHWWQKLGHADPGPTVPES